MERALHRMIYWTGIFAAVLLGLLAALGFLHFLQILLLQLTQTPPSAWTDLSFIDRSLDLILLIFIVIELLKIAVSYVHEENVLPTVFEATLVAIARKIVVLGSGAITWEKAGALAILLIAPGLCWNLVRRQMASELQVSGPEGKSTMQRKYIDCRDYPGSNCTLRISGTEDEVIKAAVQHGVSAHGYQDTPDFRNELRKSMREEQVEGRKVSAGGTKAA